MREPPNLSESAIAAALRTGYGIAPHALTFLPIGNDIGSASWRADCPGVSYFVKARRRAAFSAASLEVPRFLADLGVPHIPSPMRTSSGALSIEVEDFAISLYPFIAGRPGADPGMSDEQWTAFGATMRQIHAAVLPPDLQKIVPRETFVAPRRQLIGRIEKALSAPTNPIARELAESWSAHREQIRTVVERADSIGTRLRDRSPAAVLCHADLHTRNVLVEPNDEWWLIDWDEAVIAPRERDLMFVIRGIVRGFVEPHQTRAFLLGYGDIAADAEDLTYYRCAWAVQDIATDAEQVLFLPELSESARRHGLDGFKSLFEPGNIVEIALSS
jgi:spectinomycin phosphotransferase